MRSSISPDRRTIYTNLSKIVSKDPFARRASKASQEATANYHFQKEKLKMETSQEKPKKSIDMTTKTKKNKYENPVESQKTNFYFTKRKGPDSRASFHLTVDPASNTYNGFDIQFQITPKRHHELLPKLKDSSVTFKIKTLVKDPKSKELNLSNSVVKKEIIILKAPPIISLPLSPTPQPEPENQRTHFPSFDSKENIRKIQPKRSQELLNNLDESRSTRLSKNPSIVSSQELINAKQHKKFKSNSPPKIHSDSQSPEGLESFKKPEDDYSYSQKGQEEKVWRKFLPEKQNSISAKNSKSKNETTKSYSDSYEVIKIYKNSLHSSRDGDNSQKKLLDKSERTVLKSENILFEPFDTLNKTSEFANNNGNNNNGNNNNKLLSRLEESAVYQTNPNNLAVFNSPYQVRDKTYFFITRYGSYYEFIAKINFSNMIIITPQPKFKPSCTYKFHVMKGNNHMLIKSAFKHRWWWTSAEPSDPKTFSNINFLWSPWRCNDYIQTLKYHPYDDSTLSPKNRNQIKYDDKDSNSNTNSTMDSSIIVRQSIDEIRDSSINRLDRMDRNENRSERYGGSNAATISNSVTNSLTNSLANSLANSVDFSQNPNLLQSSNIIEAKANDPASIKYNILCIKRVLSNNDIINYIQFENYCKSMTWTDNQTLKIQSYLEHSRKVNKNSRFGFTQITNPLLSKICNHMENNFLLSNKKALYHNMKNYFQNQKIDPFEYIPLTFHIQNGVEDPEFEKFLNYFSQLQENSDTKNIWIIKPGENTNRGTGISISDKVEEIREILSEKIIYSNGKMKTYIIQKYIEKPLLYHRRKFDIRCYILLASINGIQKGYWYQEGYIRTSSNEFNLSNLSNKMIHLTNDAVQKNSEDYGKFENANKISYADIQKYMEFYQPEKKFNFMDEIYPKIKNLALHAVQSVYGRLDPHRREFSFELFGLDYMLDENCKPWLIEINTNPCLELSSPLQTKILPTMIENLFRLIVDPLFPPPFEWPHSRRNLLPENCIENNKFELIFDERDYKTNDCCTTIENAIDEFEEDNEMLE